MVRPVQGWFGWFGVGLSASDRPGPRLVRPRAHTRATSSVTWKGKTRSKRTAERAVDAELEDMVITDHSYQRSPIRS